MNAVLIEIWSALTHSLPNVQKSLCHCRNNLKIEQIRIKGNNRSK